MVKIRNIFGDEYSGQTGHAGVFAKWKGRQYRRKYVIPANPDTTMQKNVRNHFTNAIALWHTWSSLQRKTYSYLASGLVLSGFNLLVRRYQLWKLIAGTEVLDPQQGIKQLGTGKTSQEDVYTVLGAGHDTLTQSPDVIGLLHFLDTGSTETQEAYVDAEMADVRIPAALTGLAVGDQLQISYQSGGRTIEHEVLYTIESGTEIPLKDSPTEHYRARYHPIELGTVTVDKVETPGGSETRTALKSVTTDSRNGKVSIDGTQTPADTDKMVYYYYTPVEDVKLEVVKTDTSFITWRDYSDEDGFLPLAQTVFDQDYDLEITKGGYDPITRAAQGATLVGCNEYIPVTAA